MSLYRIHRFSKLTGLSTHVIRAWEKRYQLVKPLRSENRYRLYNDEDVALFRYLKTQTDEGVSIGELAELGKEELLARTEVYQITTPQRLPPSEGLLSDLIQAVLAHDRLAFERKFNGAMAVIPFEEALPRFLLPLQERIGDLWHEGKLSIAQEHFVTNQIQLKVFSALNQLRVNEYGPKVVVACPSKETHELGAQTVAYLCTVRGCQTHYLGSDIPIPDLAHYCRVVSPALVLLSLTAPLSTDEAYTLALKLKEQVLPYGQIGIGGMAALMNRKIFEQEKMKVFDGLPELETFLLKVK